MRKRSRVQRALRVCLLLGPVVWWPTATRGEVWTWVGGCGTPDWYGVCNPAPCGDPDHPSWQLYRNNWGQTLCNDPDLGFPANGDDVDLGRSSVLLERDISLASLASAGPFELGANLTVAAPVTLGGPFTWFGGTLSANTTAAGGATLAAGNSLALTGCTLTTPSGTNVSLSGNNLILTAARWNQAGTLSLTGTGVTSANPDSVFSNSGIIETAGTPSISVPFANSGTVHVQSGQLTVGDLYVTDALGGSFIVDPNATLTLGNVAFDAGSQISGAGNVVFEYPASVDGSYSVTGQTTIRDAVVFNQDTVFSALSLENGNPALLGTGTVTVNGLFNWTIGRLEADTTANGGLTMSPVYPLNLTSCTLTTPHGTSVTLNYAYPAALYMGNAQWNQAGVLSMNGAVVQGGADSGLINAGTIQTTGDSTLDVPFTNTGTVQVQGGQLNLHGYDVEPPLLGSFVVAPNATLNLGGNTTIDSACQISGAGSAILGGSIVLNGQYTVTGPTTVAGTVLLNHDTSLQSLTLQNGNLGGTSALTVNGPFTWTGGTLATDTTASGGLALTAGSNLSLTGCTLRTPGGTNATLDNYPLILTAARWNHAGTLTLTSGISGDSNSLLANTGVIQTTGSSSLDVPLTNSGIVHVQSGQLNLSGAATDPPLAGSFRVDSNATLSLPGSAVFNTASEISGDGNVVFGGTAVVNGTYTVTGQTTISGAAVFDRDTTFSSLVLAGYGSLSGTGTVTVNGPFTSMGSATLEVDTTANGGLTISGGQQFNDCTLTTPIGTSASVSGFGVNFTAAAWDQDGTATLNDCVVSGDARSRVTNTGTILTARQPELHIRFMNSGTVHVQNGILSTDAYSQAAGATIIDPNSMLVAIQMELQGGELSGPGRLQGVVNNTGGMVHPGGDIPGPMTMLGNQPTYRQAAGGRLTIDLAGANAGQYGTLTIAGIGGLAVLDGTLEVRLSAGYHPPVGRSFTALTAQRVIGTFAQVTTSPPSLGVSVNYTADSVTVQVTHAPPLPGDLNCDGVVNFGDIYPFITALSSPTAYQQQYPNCDILNADCNGDGVVNFADINPFVAILSG